MNLEASPPMENAEGTATFRKPANRVYRRRSPQSGSSSSDGSPLHERKLSPLRQRNEFGKGSDDQRKREDMKESDKDYGRSRYGRNGDSYRNSDRQSSRGTRSYHRHDHRRDKYAGDDDRDYSRSRSDREHKRNYSDHYRRENEQWSRDHSRDEEKYSRAKSDGLGDKNRDSEREKNSDQKHTEKPLPSDRAGSGRRHADDLKYGERDTYKDGRVGIDEKNDHLRSSGNYRSDIVPAREGSRSHRNDSMIRRDGAGHCSREASRTDIKPFDGENNLREEKNYDDRERCREHQRRDPKKLSEVDKGRSNREEESTAKKPKLSGLDAPIAEERQSLSPKHAEEATAQGSAEQACLTDSDIDAAKVAAMKAAEMVNRNLIGTGFMSSDQKKKLLWGNKKTIAKEESTNRWDTTMLGDRERQEKFNKLMSLRLRWYIWPNVGCKGRSESGTQTRYRGCGEKERAAPVGFREAIYCWIASKRWSHCWVGSLRLIRPLITDYVALNFCIFGVFKMCFNVAIACTSNSLWLKLYSQVKGMFIMFHIFYQNSVQVEIRAKAQVLRFLLSSNFTF